MKGPARGIFVFETKTKTNKGLKGLSGMQFFEIAGGWAGVGILHK
jgi:hypothetical protein